MKYLIIGILGFFISIAIVYCCFAFFWLTFNPKLWNEPARFLFVLCGLSGGIIGTTISIFLLSIYDGITIEIEDSYEQ